LYVPIKPTTAVTEVKKPGFQSQWHSTIGPKVAEDGDVTFVTETHYKQQIWRNDHYLLLSVQISNHRLAIPM
jgi:hypothetical protein